jgi:hypothetical protein
LASINATTEDKHALNTSSINADVEGEHPLMGAEGEEEDYSTDTDREG